MCSYRTRLLTCTSNEFSWWPLTVHTDSKRDYWALMGNTAFCLQDQNDNCKWFCIALFDCYCVNDFFSTIVSGTSLNGMENLKCNFTMWSDLCVRYWYRLFCDMLQTWPYKYSICLLINRVFQCLKDTSNENDIHQEKVKTEKNKTLFCMCAVIFRFCGLAQNVTFPSDPDGENPRSVQKHTWTREKCVTIQSY